MKFFAFLDLWFTLLVGAPHQYDVDTEAPPPPTEQASSDSKDDDGSGRRWLGYMWVGPSINNGY